MPHSDPLTYRFQSSIYRCPERQYPKTTPSRLAVDVLLKLLPSDKGYFDFKARRERIVPILTMTLIGGVLPGLPLMIPGFPLPTLRDIRLILS